MARSVIITCAPTRGIHPPTMSEHLPVTPGKIPTASIEAAGAGASVIHLHARASETGGPAPNPDLFMGFQLPKKQATDAVLNISTGGGPGMTRGGLLRAAVCTSPGMAGMNMRSMNFAVFPMKDKHTDWKHAREPELLEMTRDFIFRNTFADIGYCLNEPGQGHGTRFGFECYAPGHLCNLAWIRDQGRTDGLVFVQMVFGIPGGVGADPDNLMHMHTIANKLFGDSYEWPVPGPATARQIAQVAQASPEITPLSTLRFAGLLNEILPAGVVTVFHGPGGSVGDQLISAPPMEAITVTGSP